MAGSRELYSNMLLIERGSPCSKVRRLAEDPPPPRTPKASETMVGAKGCFADLRASLACCCSLYPTARAATPPRSTENSQDSSSLQG